MLAILTSHPIQYQAPLWRALARAGVNIEVWFLTDHAVNPSHDREFGKRFAWDQSLTEGYPHHFLPVRPGWRMDRFRGIHVIEPWSKLFSERGVDRLWVEGWRFRENWSAIFAARKMGIEVWLRGETNDLRQRKGLKACLRQVLLARLFRCVRYFLCIGSANRRFYRSFKIEEERLLAAPYCVDNLWFAEQAQQVRTQQRNIRDKWAIPHDAFCLLFCGKFIPKKHPMDLVLAVRKIKEDRPDRKIHLLFVGSGSLGDKLRESCHVVFDAEAAATGLPHNSTPGNPVASFAGFLNQGEIAQAYVAADCLVLPSDNGETWGLVVNEAMATGLPCIASDQCGCAEDMVRPLSPAGVFPMGDIETLAQSIEYQIANPIPAESVKGQAADFGIERIVKTVIENYSHQTLLKT